MAQRSTARQRPEPVLPSGAQLCARLAPWVRVRHDLPRHPLADPVGHLRQTLRSHGGSGVIEAGTRIAVAVGSRGIVNLPALVREVVDFVSSQGATPFIVPAMGSHGGGTAEGQVATLAGLGVTPELMGCEIRPEMDTVVVGEAGGVQVHCANSVVSSADGVIPVARIKPHTDFRGPVESGVLKMLAIGLGKYAGADSIHAVPLPEFSSTLQLVGEVLLGAVNVPLSVAIVEDAHEETSVIEVLSRDELLEREPELLSLARDRMPRLPFTEADVLVVQRMGKNISGAGMDPNVTGRYYRPTPTDMKVERLVVLELTEQTHGNACGVGLADIVTRRLADNIDWHATYTNEVAARLLEGARLPLVARDDQDALAVAVHSLGRREAEDARIAFIRDTLTTTHLMVSEPLWRELAESDAPVERLDARSPSFNNGMLDSGFVEDDRADAR